MLDLERSAVVIPAFNEEKQIGEVVEAAQSASPFLVDNEHVIVVDNNSSDRTVSRVESMGALVIDCIEQGKGQAMSAGVEQARKTLGSKVITFLDGDLTGLKGSHINQLVEPVVYGRAPMTAGIVDLWDNWLIDRITWPSLSGERSIHIDYWDKLEPEDKRGFYIETAINTRAIEQGWFGQVQNVRLEGVSHDERRKIKERGVLQGSIEYAQTYMRAAKSYLNAYSNR